MNKTELIDTVAKDSSLARTDAAKAVESIWQDPLRSVRRV